MVKATRSRGPGSTPEGKRRTGRPSATPAAVRYPLGLGVPNRVIALALWVAVMLHAPFIPLDMLAFLRAWIGGNDTFEDFDGGEALLPVEFDLELPGLEGPDPGGVADPSGPADPDGMPVVAPVDPDGELDAGVEPDADVEVDAGLDEDAGLDDLDAGTEDDDAGPDELDAGVEEDAGDDLEDGGAPVAEADAGGRLKDPNELSGPKELSKYPNVQVLIVSKNLRTNPVGPKVSALLADIPEWKTFFGGTGVDLIRDIDHLRITGPQLRDSSQVVVLLDYSVDRTKIRGAIDHIVTSTKGTWLKKQPVRDVARAKADRSERLFALSDTAKMVGILPKDADQLVAEINKIKPFTAKTSAAVALSIVTPWRAFGGIPGITVDKSIAKMNVYFTPTAAGGVSVRIEAVDADDKLAAQHAEQLEGQFGTIVFGAGFVVGTRLSSPTFSSDGNIIKGEWELPPDELNALLDYIHDWLKDLRKKK